MSSSRHYFDTSLLFLVFGAGVSRWLEKEAAGLGEEGRDRPIPGFQGSGETVEVVVVHLHHWVIKCN